MSADEATPLHPTEVRVLGSLIEKEITTPDYYPLTLHALTNACNQTSNREPVVDFDEQTVVRALDALRERKWSYLFSGADSRVPKYGHRLTESLELERREIAVLCVLMLRGPQTVGEIRIRTARMHPFENLPEAEATLEALAARAAGPLVAKLPRQAGLKEQRYAHLLAGDAGAAAAAAAMALDSAPRAEAATTAVRLENERLARLEQETGDLRQELADLRRQFVEFRRQFD